jgi:hypothetical protein
MLNVATLTRFLAVSVLPGAYHKQQPEFV